MVMGHKNDASLENCHILAQATGFFMCCSSVRTCRGDRKIWRPLESHPVQYLKARGLWRVGYISCCRWDLLWACLSSGGHLARVLASRNAQRVHAARPLVRAYHSSRSHGNQVAQYSVLTF